MKKKYVVLLVGMLVIIVIVALTVGNGTSKKISSRITTSGVGTANTTQNSAGAKVDTSNFNSAQDSEGYTVYYPKDWTQKKQAMTNKTGVIYLLQPQTASPSNPHITIQVVDAKLTSMDALTPEFKVFGYKKTSVTVNGVAATKYDRVIPTTSTTLHTVAYIFEKNGKIYLFKLGYKQQAADPQIENQFTQIVYAFSTN